MRFRSALRSTAARRSQATAAAVQAGTRDPMTRAICGSWAQDEIDWDSSSETTQIVADKKSYAPGDTAHLSIVSETDGFYALVDRAGRYGAEGAT